MSGRGPRGSNVTCLALSQLSVTSPATHKQIGSFWCWFLGGFVYILGPCGSLQWTLLWGWQFVPPPQTPQVFPVRGFEALFHRAGTPGLHGLSRSPVVPGERNINQLPLACPHPRTKPITQAYALTGNEPATFQCGGWHPTQWAIQSPWEPRQPVLTTTTVLVSIRAGEIHSDPYSWFGGGAKTRGEIHCRVPNKSNASCRLARVVQQIDFSCTSGYPPLHFLKWNFYFRITRFTEKLKRQYRELPHTPYLPSPNVNDLALPWNIRQN